MLGIRARACVALAVTLAAVALDAGLASAHTVALEVRDALGLPLPARVHVVDGNGASYPQDPDSLLFAFYGGDFLRSFFYTTGDATLTLPSGLTTISIAHGFEHRPRALQFNLQADTTLAVTLPRVIDMASLGWFSGDNHVHTHHPPLDYAISPEEALRLSQAEDLNMVWLLDNGRHFSGAPDPVSSASTTIYYTTEYRNQCFGHVALLGLKDSLDYGCCLPPAEAYPMLTDFRAEWNPASDEALSLCHPIDGANFFDDDAWPAWGLARELPILAANGAIDVYDIASYGNENDTQVYDWYQLLNCGFRIPAGAGSDSRLNSYFIRPLGGLRVYVKEPGPLNDPADYVQGLRAGTSFVTNFPLVLDFSVDGLEAGSVANVTGPSVDVPIHFRVLSLVGAHQAKIIRNGEVVETITLSPNLIGTDQTIDTQVPIFGSSWVAVRVEGSTNQQFVSGPSLFAHTSPVYFVMDGVPQQSTAASTHWLDWIDSLGVFVEMRGAWTSDAHRTHVLFSLEDARNVYRAQYHVAPGAFSLLAPDDGDTLTAGSPLHFDWDDAIDPEPGDRVLYQLTIASDSLFSSGPIPPPATLSSELTIQNPFLPTDKNYWWRVSATDRGGLRTFCTPSKRRFFWRASTTGVPTPSVEQPPSLWVWPNPSTAEVGFRASSPLTATWGLEILGVDGRRLARTGPSGEGGGPWLLKRTDDILVWRARDSAGRPLPSGSYFARLVSLDGSAPNPPATRVLLLR